MDWSLPTGDIMVLAARRTIFPPLLPLLFAMMGHVVALTAQETAPRLVVFLAVDQMRPDYFVRYADQLQGGLAWIAREGTLYLRGEQDHGVTETAPGHSTVLSGRSPASTGIVSNERGVGDPSFPLVGVRGLGASPMRFRGTTLFDWMLRRDSGLRVLSVSLKDRGAILPIGRAGVPVFWYQSGIFTTSRYYAETLPAWVRDFNARRSVQRAAGWQWELTLPPSSYAEPDSQPWLREGRETAFPHQLPADSTALVERFRITPLADSLTLALALAGVDALGIGQRPGGGTDLLAISLSATDIIGHRYGPDSREIHDQVLRLDRYLGQFFDSLARVIPREQWLVALTADHGVTSFPEVAILQGRTGGHTSFTPLALETAGLLEERFRVPLGFFHDNGLLMADTAAISARGMNVDSLAAALRERALELPGVGEVFTPRGLAAARTVEASRWKRAIPPGTGWLLAGVPREGYIWTLLPDVAMHGTVNPPDVLVPIAFVGRGIPAARPDRVARTVDIGPTLAALLGVTPTERVEGVPLPEVVGNR